VNERRTCTDTANKALDWLAARPWIFQALIGAMWLCLAVVAYGKGQTFAVEVAFWGMLFWAFAEDDKQAYRKLLDQSLGINRELLDIAKGKA